MYKDTNMHQFNGLEGEKQTARHYSPQIKMYESTERKIGVLIQTRKLRSSKNQQGEGQWTGQQPTEPN